MRKRKPLPPMTSAERSEALDIIAKEEAKRTRIVTIIAVAVLVLDIITVAAVLGFTGAIRSTQIASVQRAKETQAQVAQTIVVADETRRTLFLLDCAVAASTRFPTANSDPVARQKSAAYLQACFVLNNVQGEHAIKLPPEPR